MTKELSSSPNLFQEVFNTLAGRTDRTEFVTFSINKTKVLNIHTPVRSRIFVG